MPIEMLLPPGYLSLASMAAVGDKARAGAAKAEPATIEILASKGMIICGSPDSVAQQLEHHQKESATARSSPMMQFGTLPHDLTTKSTEMFAKEVIPYFRARADVIPARAERMAQGA